MKKIILLVLVIIFAFIWNNQPKQFSPKNIQEKKLTTIKPSKLRVKPISKVILEPAINLIPPDYQCKGKTTCSQMNSCKEAKFYLQTCHLKNIDGDKDGIPCEGRWCFHRKSPKKK